ncbi:MAG: ArsB/NhaD family transporter [Anaerolineae bacterium]|jgi:Na+/H+ antiporter NhaD/arsenite permease-like protein|nr:ArsB/NhaD family transporter [Anaerolineae bacterium]MBT7072562.1 ArsB/NhaD family transporter [Anaerolineae bacterium]MBT7324612.1 ArsB/NhaD family transporter [Anaerolineae bacterium]
MNHVWLAGGIFFFTFALIVSEKIDRTISALLGGLSMIIFGIVSQDQAFHSVDWNVIFLLAGMMVIANVLKETGLFQWIALQAVRMGKGDPMRILVILSLVTGVTSAFLDNVTIVVLIAPVTLFIASTLGLSPIPFLIAEVLASNIGGMATLVGDPPNILIGSAANIDFLTFISNMGPISLIIMFIFIGMMIWMFKDDLHIKKEDVVDINSLDTDSLITDPVLLRKALVVMTGVVIGFLAHGALHLQPATIALTGATILMLWGRSDPHKMFRDIEWTTLFFFIGLFIAVEAVVETGIIESIAEQVLALTGGKVANASMFLIWFSAITSGIIDNIPYTATMIPLVESMGLVMPVSILWWSLALGACLGGNLTLVGAAANVIVASLAEKAGHKIGFWVFFKYGASVTAMSLVVASLYVWARYL